MKPYTLDRAVEMSGVERGWLRALDRAFVAFLGERDPQADPLVLLAAALASHQLGRGHACLDLHEALGDADAVLAASVFHFGTLSIAEVKDALRKDGIEVR